MEIILLFFISLFIVHNYSQFVNRPSLCLGVKNGELFVSQQNMGTGGLVSKESIGRITVCLG